MGGSSSKSESESKSDMSQDVWGGQQGALQDLYGNASALWGQNMGQMGQMQNQADMAAERMNQSYTGQQPAWMNQLGGGVYSGTNDAVNQSLVDSLSASMSGPSNMGQMYESIVGGEGNTYIDPMVDAMKQSTQQDLERYGVPQTDAAAVAAGQSGSSRHGIAEGLMRADAAQNMANQEAQMRGQAYDKDLAMKMNIAQQADLGKGQAQQRAIDLMNSQNAAQQWGLGQGGMMQQQAMGGMAPYMQMQQAPWQAFGQYANAIGGPTILGSGSQSGSSKASAASGGMFGG